MIVRFVPDTPQYLIGDSGRIRQMIVNLVSNAIKFTEKGYVLIIVEEDKEAKLRDGRLKIKISVQDTGIGIPKDKQQVIFDKFSQADSSTTRQFGGTGLGLAICRELSQMMDGEIGVDSDVGEGSTFWFTIALEKDSSEKKREIIPADNLDSLRVLIVDDVDVNCVLLEERLSGFGMRPDICNDSIEALKKMSEAVKQGDPYNIALIDYIMPGMNGEELAKEIKANEELNRTALIMLTAASGKADFRRYSASGFSAFLTKPVYTEELLETLSLVWQEYNSGNTNAMITGDNSMANDNDNGMDVIQFRDTRILLAEDNKTNQGFAIEILEGANCNVDVAEDGKMAVDMVSGKPYDLIFMDCEMPEMNGFDASLIISKMKKDRVIEEIPIVALTANAMKGDKEKCLGAGMDDYLSKPMRKAEMLGMLRKFIPNKIDKSATNMMEVRFDGYHILLVEDNRINRMMAEEMLDEIGFDIDMAVNGKESVNAVKNIKYDLILMDMQMPVMDGLEATRIIKKMASDGDIGNVPIIALTANAMEGDRNRCLEAGMDDYLSKPVKKADLNIVIAKWLEPNTEEEKDGNKEFPVLDEDFLYHYRDIMGKKFITGVEEFLKNTQEIINNIIEACNKGDVKTIKILAHSLKSSSAMLGAMELSRLAEILETDVHDMVENRGRAHPQNINADIAIDMDKALKRAAPFFLRHLDNYTQNIKNY